MWVYLLGEATEGRVIKVGKTDKPTVADRIKTVNADQHSDQWFVLLAAMRGDKLAETRIKDHFASIREDRGRRTEYFKAEDPIVEYMLWLRSQYFVSVSANDPEDLVPAEDFNLWLPRDDRRRPRPPIDDTMLFSRFTQLKGELAGTAWDWVPDPFESYQDYFTPAEIVSRASDAMGGIDLDAASHFLANKRLVQHGVHVGRYFTRAYSAFDHPWEKRVWLNPPYGENLPWFERIAHELAAGRTEQVCMLSPMWAFSTIQAQQFMASASAMVVLSPTPKFHNPGDPTKTGVNDPHAIVYWGSHPERFTRAFADVGIPCRILS